MPISRPPEFVPGNTVNPLPISSIEPTHLLAVVLALAGTFSTAAASLFVRLGTDEGRASDGVLVVIGVNVLVLTPLVAVVYYPEYGLTPASILSFVAAGVLGTMLGRAFKYTAIDRIGASRAGPIVASWALVSTALGVVVLGETLSVIHGIAVVLIVGGVTAIAWETSRENPDDLPRRELLVGLLIPVGAALAYGSEPIFARVGFEAGTPAVVGLVVKTVSASIGFFGYLRFRNALPTRAVLRPADLRWFVLAGLANTLFLLGYYTSLSIAPVSVVSPVVATSTLFVVLLSAVFMPSRLERVTWRLVTAATVVVVGVVLITVYG